MASFVLDVLPGRLAICRLAASGPLPAEAPAAPLWSVMRTGEELSIICPEEDAPPGALVQGGWRSLTLRGPFDLTTETGVLVAVLQPLAEARIGIFALSTYDTDHVLVAEEHLPAAIAALRAAGHTVHP